MINKKGFSMVELLAVVAILGILSGIAISVYTKYHQKAKQQAYETLVESAKEAAENYSMEHPTASSVNFDTLVEEGYLENANDPSSKGNECAGTVRIKAGNMGHSSRLTKNEYTVYICCSEYQYEIGETTFIPTQECMADFSTEKFIEKQPTVNCKAGEVKKKEFYIYTMNYIGKVCEKGADGKYGQCYDKDNPNGNKNYPCRMYDYHQRKCTCNYSNNTNKYCSSSAASSGDDHTMKIKYNESSAGHNSCSSDDPSDFNSNVHDVCWYGLYSGSSTVMTFHGYQFFQGQSSGYTSFDPNGSWFHDALGDGGNFDVRVARGVDVGGKPDYEQGCRDTCIRFTEVISGKVS